MNSTEQTFVEVAARTLLDILHPGHHLSGYRSDCNSCSGSGVVYQSVHYEMHEEPCPYVGKSEWALTHAALLLGMLIERNGPLEEIVRAARETHGITDGDAENMLFADDTAFFRAITLEALGEGKVFDTFAEFKVGEQRPHTAHCTSWWYPQECDCNCGGPKRFSVPRLAVEGAQS
jgi:hypothetical protein